MVPGKEIVHVSRPFVAVDARIEYRSGIKLAGEASGYREAGRAATDDKDVKKRIDVARYHDGDL